MHSTLLFTSKMNQFTFLVILKIKRPTGYRKIPKIVQLFNYFSKFLGNTFFISLNLATLKEQLTRYSKRTVNLFCFPLSKSFNFILKRVYQYFKTNSYQTINTSIPNVTLFYHQNDHSYYLMFVTFFQISSTTK